MSIYIEKRRRNWGERLFVEQESCRFAKLNHWSLSPKKEIMTHRPSFVKLIVHPRISFRSPFPFPSAPPLSSVTAFFLTTIMDNFHEPNKARNTPVQSLDLDTVREQVIRLEADHKAKGIQLSGGTALVAGSPNSRS